MCRPFDWVNVAWEIRRHRFKFLTRAGTQRRIPVAWFKLI